MSDPDKPIRISGRQLAEWGPFTQALATDTIRAIIEEKTGKPHEWRQEWNIDAITLCPVDGPTPREDRPAFGRVDIFDGQVTCQYLPGRREDLIVALMSLADELRAKAPVPFIMASEVAAVKE